MQHLERPALGRLASIGTLYDANSDRFLGPSIIPDELLDGNVSTGPSVGQIQTEARRCTSFFDAFSALGIDHDTAVNVLCGLVDPHGASVFLRDYSLSNRSGRLSILSHQVSTVKQMLENHPQVFGSNGLLIPQDTSSCTHLVTGVLWGLQTLAAFNKSPPPSPRDPASDQDEAIDADVLSLKLAVDSTGLSQAGAPSHEPVTADGNITLYSDALPDDGLVMRDHGEVLQFIRLVPAHLKHESDGKGWPLAYCMIPVACLSLFSPEMQKLPQDLPRSIRSEITLEIIRLFDDFGNSKAGLLDYRDLLSRRRLHVAEGHFQDVSERISFLSRAMMSLTEMLRQLLVDERQGRADPSQLYMLLQQISDSEASPQFLSSIVGQERDKLRFIHDTTSQGAKYIGFNGIKLDTILKAARHELGHYIFRFGLQSMQNKRDWEDSLALLTSLLDQDPQLPIYLVDDDATNESGGLLPAPCISFYKAGIEEIADVLARNRFMDSHCLARYRDEDLDRSARQRPSKRRLVKIPCPCEDCGPMEREWICPECRQNIEYGFTDSFFYCDCGRCLYSSYKFKCNDEKHKSGYSRYEAEEVHKLLRGLDTSNYVNILIMGETGVGKSTFINAFVNYLSFSTLEEALEADGLTSVIPCSFSLQTMDRDHPELGIKEHNIKVGVRDDEADGSAGDSATQKTAVYPVTIGSKTYRLIDTPGIGDTRGTSFDKQNMADILATISSYDDLHGILILLKSNNSRLTVTFRFCVQELLTHLHRSAAEAMAFGFTNTRISNYTPGDTFKPLKKLLTEFSDVGLSLNTSTTYCFDSESFRYLAACKQGVQVDNEEDFRRSWNHSRKEALRLIDYFASTSPHPVVSTLSLHGTRRLISSMMTPMAQISELVVKNLAFYEDQRNTLADTQLSAQTLRGKLHIKKIQFVARQLNRPRTVCKRTECCEFKDSGKGDGEVITIYKTHCHPECYLDNVTQDVVADPGLIQCAAFAGRTLCTVCDHNWQEHLHILYELDEVIVKVKDEEIKRQLKAKADVLTLRLTGIQTLDKYIEESKAELAEIRRAAGRFWLFLEANAITPVNNATLEYLDMLIKQEKDKVLVGRQHKMSVERNVERLEALETEKKEHIQLLETLDQNMKQPKGPEDEMLDEAGVDALVQKLYQLKHFGGNLRDVKYVISSAMEGTNRERPFRVATRPSHHSSMRGGHGRMDRSKRASSRRGRGKAHDRDSSREETDRHRDGRGEPFLGDEQQTSSWPRTFAEVARSNMPTTVFGFDMTRDRRGRQGPTQEPASTRQKFFDFMFPRRS